VPATDKSVFVFRPAATFDRVNHKLIKDVAAVTTRALVFCCLQGSLQSINQWKKGG
jgi:hypothetical protein